MSDFPKKTLADWEKLAAKELRDKPLIVEARSLDYAALRAASLGTTAYSRHMRWPCP